MLLGEPDSLIDKVDGISDEAEHDKENDYYDGDCVVPLDHVCGTRSVETGLRKESVSTCWQEVSFRRGEV